MKKIMKIFMAMLLSVSIACLMPSMSAKADIYVDSTANTSISYKAHVENIGWQNEVSNGATAGTVGNSLSMQAIQINYPNNEGLHLEYQVHVSNIGWMKTSKNGEIAGTTGQNLPMEALAIAIQDSTGKASTNYSVYYRTHIRNKGWTTWTKNGSISGTTGQNLQMEGIQVCVAKVGTSRYYEMESLVDPTANTSISYKAHVAEIGWQNQVADGATAGTVGKLLSMQAIQINYANTAGLHLEYQVHVSNIGWMKTSKNGEIAGTTGQNLPMEAIAIAIQDSTGKASTNYSVYYRTHISNKGWTNWTKDGSISGTTGQNLQMEGIQVCVAKVGTAKYSEMEALVNQPLAPIPAPANSTLANFVKIANSQVGYAESPTNRTKYGQWFRMDGNEWCAMFVSWCANQAGILNTTVPSYAGCANGADWYKARGRYRTRESGYIPKAGDVIFFNYSGINHTGIVEFSSASIVYTIEGNSGDAVRKNSYGMSSGLINGYGVN